MLSQLSCAQTPTTSEMPSPCTYYTRPWLVLLVAGIDTPAIDAMLAELQGAVPALEVRWIASGAAGGANLELRIDPTDRGIEDFYGAGVHYPYYQGCSLVSSRIVFYSDEWADHEGVVLHELLHAMGLRHRPEVPVDEIAPHPERRGARLADGEAELLRERYR